MAPILPSIKPMAGPESIHPNKAIRDYVQTPEAAQDWKLADKARALYDYQRIITTTLFSPKDETQRPMPDVLVAVDKLPTNVLGAFHLAPDGLGLRHKITMNSLYAERPVWEQLETLTHELVHVFINDVLGHKDTHNHHTGEFVGLMADLGFKVKPGEGYHLAPAEGQFARLMDWLEVPQPPAVKDAGEGGGFILPPGSKYWWDGDRGGNKGRSTLVKYTADSCVRPKVCSFRAGLRDLQVKCASDGCSGIFKPDTSASS